MAFKKKPAPGPGGVTEAAIPYAPRRWAYPVHQTLKRWMCLVLHRRAGKTTFILNHHLRAALDDTWETARLRAVAPEPLTDAQIAELLRGRTYGHVMPTRIQAKSVAWEMLKYYAGFVPGAKPHESELYVKLPGNRRVYLIGADDPDAHRGRAFSGLSFDEWSQQPETVFSEVLSKSLADHLGYAIFAGTIKGRDQLYKMHESAVISPEWVALWQDIDTSLQTEGGVTTVMLKQAMADDRKLVREGLMTQADFDQEWYLSPEAAIKGAILGKELAAARLEGRITAVPCDPALPVDTWWDLGMDDAMAIWFTQQPKGGALRVLRYFEHSGEGMPFYVQKLKDFAYVYGKHHAPHDIEVRELSTGKSRKAAAANLGLWFTVVDRLSQTQRGEVEEGIHAMRLLLPRCWFDARLCQAGLDGLLHFRRPWNKHLQQFMPGFVHDWSSHPADAFRTLAIGLQPVKEKRKPGSIRDGFPGAGQPTDQDWMRG